MCIRDRVRDGSDGSDGSRIIAVVLQRRRGRRHATDVLQIDKVLRHVAQASTQVLAPVSYTHLRAHETVLDLVCRLLLEKKKHKYMQPRHS